MSAAITPPFLVAALLLCVAGVLKLRSPGMAGGALRTLGLPGATWLVRGLAAGELALGVVCVVGPTRATAAVLTGAYVMFAGVATALRRRGAACGCFGDDDLPVSLAHVIASGLLATLALVAAFAGPRGLGWVLGRPDPQAAVLIVGIVGAVYATVLAYTQLPAAWAAWSGR